MVDRPRLAPQLVILSGPQAGTVVVLDDALPVVFGTRSGVDLPDPALDPVHCQLFQAGGRWFLQDFASPAGTWIGDERVEGVRPLDFGRAFRIGQTHLALVLPEDGQPATEEFVEAAEAALLAATRQAGEAVRSALGAPEPAAEEPAPVAPVGEDAVAPVETDEAAMEWPTLPPPAAAPAGVVRSSRRLAASTEVFDLDLPPAGAEPEAPEGEPAARDPGAALLQADLRRHESFGDYDVLRVLGEGTLGKVYKGYDRRRRRVVAIKVLAPRLARDTVAVARFLRGAKVGSRLKHPHIVSVLAAGHAAHRIYVSMEYVEGLDLERSCQAFGGKLPARIALGIASRLTEALVYAHGRGVIHRLITPRNVMVGPGGFPKLADLALAKRVSEGSGREHEITDSGEMLLRDASYTAPEAAFDLKSVDERTDVYGLGATLFRALTGEPPLAGSPADVVSRLERGDHADPARLAPELSPALVALLRQALAADPDDRFQSARELREALLELPELG